MKFEIAQIAPEDEEAEAENETVRGVLAGNTTVGQAALRSTVEICSPNLQIYEYMLTRFLVMLVTSLKTNQLWKRM